jgi:ribosomal protein S18 acetylase RimI-like enzyme
LKIDLPRLSADASLVDLLSLRTERVEDGPGLLRLYRAVRGPEFIHLSWPEDTLIAMLESQKQLQEEQYSALYPDLQRLVLADRYGPAGRLLLAPQSGRIRIAEVSLLPAYQNRGLGTGLVRALLRQAGEQRCEVRVSLTSTNPAARFFVRLGFEDMGGAPHHTLRWLPKGKRT